MLVTVVGGTGLIGSKLVERLRADGHDARPAAPSTGVDTLTGAGLDEALAGADVVVDVSNSPSFADDDVLQFFTTSTRNLLEAEARAGVRHHVALSVVGADRLPDSGYLRAKVAQEALIAASGTPYSIVRATQFFEFTRAIAESATVDGQVHLPPATYQPMASDDVVAAVLRAAEGDPVNGVAETGGPERLRMSDFVASVLASDGDPRPVVADPHARYFGTEIDDDSLVPGPDAALGSITYDAWARSA